MEDIGGNGNKPSIPSGFHRNTHCRVPLEDIRLPGSGYYWSARNHSDTNAYYVSFSSSGTYMRSNNRSYGFSVRCVAEKATKTKRIKIGKFDISVRTSIIGFGAIATISICEAVFYGACEHLFYTLVCGITLGLNIFLYLKK
jgi:hypothetical protein